MAVVCTEAEPAVHAWLPDSQPAWHLVTSVVTSHRIYHGDDGLQTESPRQQVQPPQRGTQPQVQQDQPGGENTTRDPIHPHTQATSVSVFLRRTL